MIIKDEHIMVNSGKLEKLNTLEIKERKKDKNGYFFSFYVYLVLYEMILLEYVSENDQNLL